MRQAVLAIGAGLLVGALIAWWQLRDDPKAAQAKQARAEQAAAAQAADAVPSLYRWRDANGVLQISEQPPKGQPYERIPREIEPGIEIRGD